jgi:hypothetical protein
LDEKFIDNDSAALVFVTIFSMLPDFQLCTKNVVKTVEKIVKLLFSVISLNIMKDFVLFPLIKTKKFKK